MHRSQPINAYSNERQESSRLSSLEAILVKAQYSLIDNESLPIVQWFNYVVKDLF